MHHVSHISDVGNLCQSWRRPWLIGNSRVRPHLRSVLYALPINIINVSMQNVQCVLLPRTMYLRPGSAYFSHYYSQRYETLIQSNDWLRRPSPSYNLSGDKILNHQRRWPGCKDNISLFSSYGGLTVQLSQQKSEKSTLERPLYNYARWVRYIWSCYRNLSRIEYRDTRLSLLISLAQDVANQQSSFSTYEA